MVTALFNFSNWGRWFWWSGNNKWWRNHGNVMGRPATDCLRRSPATTYTLVVLLSLLNSGYFIEFLCATKLCWLHIVVVVVVVTMWNEVNRLYTSFSRRKQFLFVVIIYFSSVCDVFTKSVFRIAIWGNIDHSWVIHVGSKGIQFKYIQQNNYSIGYGCI